MIFDMWDERDDDETWLVCDLWINVTTFFLQVHWSESWLFIIFLCSKVTHDKNQLYLLEGVMRINYWRFLMRFCECEICVFCAENFPAFKHFKGKMNVCL